LASESRSCWKGREGRFASAGSACAAPLRSTFAAVLCWPAGSCSGSSMFRLEAGLLCGVSQESCLLSAHSSWLLGEKRRPKTHLHDRFSRAWKIMMRLRILFSEGSSLTAREFLNVLGPAGHHIEVVDPNPGCICRFSRWTKRVHRSPVSGLDPIGYIAAINGLLAERAFDVLLPTHKHPT
jgi:hypothetical protein